MCSARHALKRLLDLELSLLVLVLLSPLLAVISFAVWRRHGTPILFSQTRPGLGERPFRILKFRSMTNEVDERGRLRPNAERLTSLGRFLRGTSLDELPALINVVRGEMSLVGPRPLLTEYLPHYTEEERLRHSVRPGVTGLAQVSGRNALSWREKLARDLEYVSHWSLWLDAVILLRTVAKLARRGKAEVATEGGDAVPASMAHAPWKYGRENASDGYDPVPLKWK